MKGMALAAMHADTRLHLCFLDADAAMIHASSTPDTRWTGSAPEDTWDHLGGAFTTTPAMVATNAPANPQRITESANTPPRRHAATDPGLTAAAAAAAARAGIVLGGDTILDPEPRLDVLGLGTDYAMYHQILWQGRGRPIGMGPSGWDLHQLPDGGHRLRRGAHRPFRGGPGSSDLSKIWNGQTWMPGWERIGSAFTSDASAVFYAAEDLAFYAVTGWTLHPLAAIPKSRGSHGLTTRPTTTLAPKQPGAELPDARAAPGAELGPDRAYAAAAIGSSSHASRVIPPRFGDADDRMSADERTSAQVRVTFGSLRADRLRRVPKLLRH